MSFRFRRALFVLALLAPALSASAQDWSFAFSGFVFDPPEESSYFSPIFYADRGALHLEGRFNYEDRDAASVFVGRNFETGEEVTFTAVPMFGLVFGSTTGVAPGAEIEIGWPAFDAAGAVPAGASLGALEVRERRRWSSLLAPVYLQLLEGLRRVTEGQRGAGFCKECGQPFLTLDARRSVFCTDPERLRYGQRERRRRLGAAPRRKGPSS